MTDEIEEPRIILTLRRDGEISSVHSLSLGEAEDVVRDLSTQVAAARREVAGAGPAVRSMLTSEVIRMTGCPNCGAARGRPCVRVRGGKPRTRCHAERWRAARTIRDSRE